MLNLKDETRTLTDRVEVLTNQKWDAISNASRHCNNIRGKLFDDVSLALSGIEGKLKFATGSKVWDGQVHNIEDDFTRDVVIEAKEKVAETRKVLIEIMNELREGSDKLFN
jgi:hypothetical protein